MIARLAQPQPARNRTGTIGILALAALLAWLPVQAAETIRIAVGGLPSNAGDPLPRTWLPAMFTQAAVFDPLVMVGSDGEARPWLATEWQMEAPTRWVFRLREDVAFSNGERLTAAGVARILDFLRTPKGQSTSAARDLASVVAAEARDDRTLVLTTDGPNPFLPKELYMLLLPAPEAYERLGPQDFSLQPVGTGPFKVDSWESARVALSRHEGSWRPPLADAVEVTDIPEPSAQLQALLSRQVHLATLIGPDDIGQIRGAGMRVEVTPDPSVIGLAFITTRPGDSPLKDVRVRRALSHAVNMPATIGALLGEFALPATQGAPRVAFGHDPALEPYAYDPERAKALLAEAGYPDGFRFTAEILAAGQPYSRAAYLQIAAELAQIGVTMEVRAIPVSSYGRGLFQGEWQGDAVGIDFATAPSLDALRIFTRHSCDWVAPWFCDPDLQADIEAARAELDLDRRRALTRAVMARHRDLAPGIFMYDFVRFYGVSDRLDGFAIDLGYLQFDKMEVR